MVDASASIGGEANFRLTMNFVTRVFHTFTLGGGVRYGLLVFGDSAKVPHNLIFSVNTLYNHIM